MNDKTLVERLREHRVILKSGDYDGAQLMRAWCDMINAADTIEAQATRIEALEAALRNIQALAKKRQAEGGPDGNLKAIEGFAKQALENSNGR